MGKASGSRTPRLCSCGKRARSNGLGNDNTQRFGVLCSSCHKSYKYNKKTYCEGPGCTFVAIHGVQLEIDHIDGNKRNNKIDNLQTLCCNCHRLKTYAKNEWENRYE
jgi:predicted HNH restriction endonuclease